MLTLIRLLQNGLILFLSFQGIFVSYFSTPVQARFQTSMHMKMINCIVGRRLGFIDLSHLFLIFHIEILY